MNNKILSITKVLNENQIHLFKINHCYLCEKYSDIGFCNQNDDSVSDIIISCIENARFEKKKVLCDV